MSESTKTGSDKIVTTTREWGKGQDGVKTTVHPSIKEAADHAVKEMGKPDNCPGKQDVGKALEGQPLTKKTYVDHEKGEVTHTPVKE